MKKILMSLVLSGALACSLALPAAAASKTDGAAPAASPVEEPASLPDSILYYGTVAAVSRGDDGEMTSLRMTSGQFGEYVMLLSKDTVWIDNGTHAASDPSGLEEGEELYVFHSPVSTRSMPPQSAAFAIVRNVSQDASCAHYHEVEAVEEEADGTIRLTTDNGGLFLMAGEETALSSYEGAAPAGLAEIETGSHIMAWYGPVALSYPGQAYASHIMILNQAEEPLTRSALAVLLHTAQGSPVVSYAMDFSDVVQDAPYAGALRWAASEGLMSGYGDGTIGPDDPVTREQLAVILWRQAGSPTLMDYPGLTKYSDVGDISRFAQPALAWAHQKGLVPAGDRLGPKDAVTAVEAEQMIQALSKEG